MSDLDTIEIDGVVTQLMSHGNYRVTLPNEHTVVARICGKMRKFNIRIINGDKVTIKISRYNLEQALITFRHKKGRPNFVPKRKA